MHGSSSRWARARGGRHDRGHGRRRRRPGARRPRRAAAGRSCRQCRFCRAGRENMCERLVGYGAHEPGGMAHAFLAPATAARKLPADLDFKTACLIEHGVRSPLDRARRGRTGRDGRRAGRRDDRALPHRRAPRSGRRADRRDRPTPAQARVGEVEDLEQALAACTVNRGRARAAGPARAAAGPLGHPGRDRSARARGGAGRRRCWGAPKARRPRRAGCSRRQSTRAG